MSTFPLPRRNPQFHLIWILAALFVVVVFGSSLAKLFMDYLWWQEMGQIGTWIRMFEYRYFPALAAWILVFVVLWVAHARGMKHARTSLREYPVYARISSIALLVLAGLVSLSTVNGWTFARYMGAHAGSVAAAPGGWNDPIFGRPLEFYFFDLPFYDMLITFIAATAFFGALAYYLAARGWQLKHDMPGFRLGQEIDLSDLRRLGSLESGVLKGLIALFLFAMAAQFWLGRYGMMLSDHGNLLVGVDYVQQNLGLPLQAAKAGFAILAALLVLLGRRKLAIACAVILIVDWFLPPLVSSFYVKPNELNLEKPYLVRHIEATRQAFGIDRRAHEADFRVEDGARIDFAANRDMLDNVRLWDWRAFHDTLSQSQPLRPYTYADTDVDRYQLDGRMRQTLLAPRELDLTQLGDARDRWINRKLTFTHGYGFVMAEANRISESGAPDLLVLNAPVEIRTKSLKVARPEIYYGESSGEPVFVRTTQPEFNYPSGSTDVNTRYEGKGGFSISSFGTRALAALAEGDANVILTSAFTPESRMMMRRNILERVSTLAPFLNLDADPYLVSTPDGRLVWILDTYLTSESHPYSRSISMTGVGDFNYIRNSVKATVDAYDGDVHLYVFEPDDPLIQAYQNLFPGLFEPASAMPATLREHARSPEMMFRAQAEIYRTYHMRDPESFYNRADQWDIATFTTGTGTEPATVPPTYVVAKVPGEAKPEFMLMIQFTPRNKQNMIGLMIARCDGPALGELVFLQLPKQQVIKGPLQVEALINQDQNISKDLTLWNQQGSQVLRSQILTLPVDNSILYVAPIYIQAAQARMPQLRKIVLFQGDTLIYADTYDQALTQLRALQEGRPLPPGAAVTTSGGAKTVVAPPAGESVAPAQAAGPDPRIEMIRMHLQKYRDLSAQGKWADAGKELEAVEGIVRH